MKSFKNIFSGILILSIILMNVGVYSAPVLALEKEGFSFEQNKSDFLLKMRKDISEGEKFSANIDTDQRLKAADNIDEIKGLKSHKPVERVVGNYVEGEVLVKYKKNKINLETFSGRMAADSFSRVKSMEKKEDLKRINVSVLKIKDNKTVEEKIAELQNDPNVEYVEPNYIHPWTAVPNDPDFSNLWGLYDATNGVDIDAPKAWDIATGTDQVMVAVLDTGIAYNHPDLMNNMWDGSSGCKNENNDDILCPHHGWNYVNDGDDPIDNHGHGTHVAGTIGAEGNNNIGVAGVNWDVQLMALKVGDYKGAIAGDVIKAIDFAINNGVKIINASFAGIASSSMQFEAINNFSDAGGIFITSAGNGDEYGDINIGDNHEEDGISLYPCDYDLDNIICVAATDQDDNLWLSSDYGATSVDVGAPGVNIYSTVADVTMLLFETFEEIIPPDIPIGWIKTDNWGTYDRTSIWGPMWGNVLYGDLNYPYTSEASSTITLPAYNLSDAIGATIDFWARCDTQYSSLYWYDYMALEISDDSSSFAEFDFVPIVGGGGKFDEYTLDILSSESPTDSSGWATYHFKNIQLPDDYLTDNFAARFRWRTNNLLNFYDGCAVDDIKITKYRDGSDEQYGYMEGTSMAAPHVAGLAGLIWGYNSELTYSEVKDVILSTGDDLVSLAGKTVTGKRINAFNALDSIAPPVITNVQVATTTPTSTIISWTTDEEATSSVVYSTTTPVSSTVVFDDTSTTTHSIELTGLSASTTYYFYIESADEYGNIATSSEQSFTTPSIPDNTPPIITLIGTSTINLYLGDTYEDAGATSTDDVDGDITENIVTVNPVDINATGTYIITYNVTDSSGNPAEEVTRTVIVSEPPDTTPPDIIGLTDDTVPAQSKTWNWDSTDATAQFRYVVDQTATSTPIGEYSDAKTVTQSTGNGIYYLHIQAIDESDNESEVTTVSVILDNIPPVINLIGTSTVILYVEDVYEDEGATALDNIDGDITEKILVVNPVDTSATGTYIITYNILDVAGNSATEVTRTIIVSEPPDNTPPVITLIGTSTINLYVGDTYEDAGATSTDDIDGDLTESIVIVNLVDTSATGTYIITYNVTDFSGNPATEVTRTVIVSELIDITAPIISLIGTTTINLYIGDPYEDQGATATDDVDGDITANIVVGGDAVNTNATGTYVITYNVTDAAGNPADEITRTVIVSEPPDVIPPVITLLGTSTISLYLGDTYEDAGATSTDDVDGDITENIVVVNLVDINATGTYVITYNVSDVAGNPATEVTRTVIVSESPDITAPIISNVQVATTTPTSTSIVWSTDEEATSSVVYSTTTPVSSIIVFDDISTTTHSIELTGLSASTTYYFYVESADEHGNIATSTEQSFTTLPIPPDTTLPVITLIGAGTVNLHTGDPYEDQGATALDDIDGDITANIIVVNSVDTSAVGTYTITYNVSDISGNPAVEVIRTVVVAEPTPAPAPPPPAGGGGGGGGGGGYSPPPPTVTVVKGDINNDKKVNKYDFALMMSAWGKTGTISSDLNNDKKVNKYDFALLMANWEVE